MAVLATAFLMQDRPPANDVDNYPLASVKSVRLHLSESRAEGSRRIDVVMVETEIERKLKGLGIQVVRGLGSYDATLTCGVTATENLAIVYIQLSDSVLWSAKGKHVEASFFQGYDTNEIKPSDNPNARLKICLSSVLDNMESRFHIARSFKKD